MLELLLVIAFTGHLIAVNIASTGPLFCVALDCWGMRRNDPKIVEIGRRLATLSLVAFAAGVVLGGTLLAILWHGNPSYWSALRRVPIYRWWFFGGEAVFYLACMIPYVMFWEREGGRRWWHRLLAVLGATNLLYHFPPFFTMLSLMSTRPELANSVLDRSLYVELFTGAETLARVAHHWLSSVTTAAIALILLAFWRGVEEAPSDRDVSSNRVTAFAARIALLATTLQLPTGLWLLLVSPASAQSQLLGGEATSTVIFVIAILTMVIFLQHLATMALGDSSRATALKSAILLLIVLLLMGAVLHRTRVPVSAANLQPSPTYGPSFIV